MRESTCRPTAVHILTGEQLRSPALGGNLRALRRDDRLGLVQQITHITCQRSAGSESISQSATVVMSAV